jgi:hypothetical protein
MEDGLGAGVASHFAVGDAAELLHEVFVHAVHEDEVDAVWARATRRRGWC